MTPETSLSVIETGMEGWRPRGVPPSTTKRRSDVLLKPAAVRGHRRRRDDVTG